jgi:hypothetical protein
VATQKKSNQHSVKTKQVVEKKHVAKPHAAAAKGEVTIDRRENHDRRSQSDRRTHSVPIGVERRTLERRVKVNRRRQIDPTTCERDYSPEEIEFMGAMDAYKHRSGRMFPTCSEVLEVIKSLGYVKAVASASPILPTLDMTVVDVPAAVV